MKIPSWLEYQLSEHGLLYSTLFVCLLVVGGIFFFSDGSKEASLWEVRRWPTAEATIVSSDLSEVDTSDESGFSTRLIAKIRFRYEFNGEQHVADYSETWSRADLKDWSSILAPGEKITRPRFS